MEAEPGGRIEETGADARVPAPTPPPESSPKPSLLTKQRVALLVLLCAVLVASFLYLRHRSYILNRLKVEAERARVVLTGEPARPPDPYAEAVSKVQADRGEAEGRAAQIEVPAELKQYREARRFLAIQSAAAAEAGVRPPHDFAELAEMIKGGRELVEAPRLGRGYVLFGVGLTATGELTHYDTQNRKDVPLFADADELNSFLEGLAAERERTETALKESEAALKDVNRADKAARARLLSEIASRKKELDASKKKEELIASYYGRKTAGREKRPAPEKATEAERLFAEYQTLAGLARDFGGRSYDLRDKESAREFQARLLSFIRPAALSVLEELGTAYQTKFERPLPVTSLVRTEEYQHLLRESGNPNAADVQPPPHTTGFAFDVYYHFMTAAEQEFVMNEIARLEREGRVEALRELRDHYHVFVFPEGRPPDEKRVDKILGKSPKKS